MTDFMKIACDEAMKGITEGNGGPFGAVVVKDGAVISAGHNNVLSSLDSTAHAEIVAIRKAEQVLGTYDLSGCELYTTCYPCPMCLGAIMWARISRVYYGNSPEEAAFIGFDDKVFYEAMKSPDSNELVTLENMDCEECRRLFTYWQEMDNPTLY